MPQGRTATRGSPAGPCATRAGGATGGGARFSSDRPRPSVPDLDDPVHARRGLGPVGDEQGRASRGQFPDALGNQGRVLGIQVRGGLVQENEQGCAEKEPGQGDALGLARRKALPGFPHVRVQGELFHAREGHGFANFFL